MSTFDCHISIFAKSNFFDNWRRIFHLIGGSSAFVESFSFRKLPSSRFQLTDVCSMELSSVQYWNQASRQGVFYMEKRGFLTSWVLQFSVKTICFLSLNYVYFSRGLTFPIQFSRLHQVAETWCNASSHFLALINVGH